MEHGQKLANKVGPDYACHWWMQKHLAAKWMSPKCLRNYLTRRRRWQLLRAKLQLDEAEVSAGANLDWSRHQSCLINLRAAKTDETLCNCSCHAKFNGHEQVLGKLKRLAPFKREKEKREGERGEEGDTHTVQPRTSITLIETRSLLIYLHQLQILLFLYLSPPSW